MNTQYESDNDLIRTNADNLNATGNLYSSNAHSLQNLEMTVYPNPNIGAFNVLFNRNLPKEANLIIYNNIGQKIYSNSKLEKQVFIELNNLSGGVYYIRMIADNVIITRKFVISESN